MTDYCMECNEQFEDEDAVLETNELVYEKTGERGTFVDNGYGVHRMVHKRCSDQ